MTEKSAKSHLPAITEEQRTAALVKAAEARTARALALRRLKEGGLSPEQALAEPVLQRCKVRRLLMAIPGVGERKADAAMAKIGISDARRVQGLGPRQREAVLDFMYGQLG